ncbi:MAG: Rne/Rng family ribonuclease [Rhizobiaceae bacterium]|nr:Rne/Rng family ribonuclease [Rhizobiaceae bacterium]
MPNKMLIDASHPEETRVVVVHGNRIEEFDFESQDKKQLKGNIYLARVTRVEPSLQAAFVEYGGNRHGFLAFSEIHPDYYQIPVADRQALLRAEAESHEDEDEDEDERGNRNRRRRRGGKNRNRGEEPGSTAAASESDEAASVDEAVSAEDAPAAEASASDTPTAAEDAPQPSEAPAGEDEERDPSGPSMAASVDADVISEEVRSDDQDASATPGGGGVEDVQDGGSDESEIESVGAEDALEEVQARRRPVRRQYKIQEVIKRRQILLVQVVKEERGNKGAALTTYLSLAGRYSVLMPNTARGGGISRKITNAQDRKRLKEVVQDLEVPQGMGVILRTAGESRTKAEIKRDYEYLMRLWENVRTLTLQSTAPALVYEEGSLIKRSVRDLYNKDIDEILVSGEESYREAKDFMRMLMPSHAKVVQPYRDTVPIFVRQGVEAQLDKMLQPQVNLKSGGYIIINQTEALVAIDVNSGRSTREHSIEETALHTNLEAAEEVARQLRLRDLAGLIVIDFIDMEENRNNRTVEKRLKDHLKNDRARIQLGRISHFGLMEMSRQRIRASVLESTTKPCPHCGGTGHVRSDSSVALLVVRAIEEFLLKDSRTHITVRTPMTTAMYVLNHKRATLAELESRFGVTITIEMDETLGSQHYAIARGAVAEKPAVTAQPVIVPPEPEIEDDDIVEEEVEETVAADVAPRAPAEQTDERGDRKRRRRRRRRGGRDRDQAETGAAASTATAEDEDEGPDDDDVSADGADAAEAAADRGQDERKKRRRGRRGGRRNRAEGSEDGAVDDVGAETGFREALDAMSDGEPVDAVVAEPASEADEAPGTAPEAVPAGDAETAEAEAPAEVVKKPRRASPRKKAAAADEGVAAAPSEAPAPKRAPRKRTTKAAAAEPVEQTETAIEVAETATISVEAVDLPPEQPSPETAEPTAAPQPEVPEQAAQPDSTPPPEPDRPKRQGWWQRKGFF